MPFFHFGIYSIFNFYCDLFKLVQAEQGLNIFYFILFYFYFIFFITLLLANPPLFASATRRLPTFKV